MHVALALLLIAHGWCLHDGAEDQIQKEVDRLQGTWKVESSTDEGEVIPAREGVTSNFTIKGNEISPSVDPKEIIKFKVDPRQKPAAIDLTEPNQKTNLGIYQLDGDNLKICFSQPDSPRPTAFASTKENRCILFLLKREKK